MIFHTQGFTERYAKMGDEAEGIFLEWAKSKEISVVQFGLKRPPFNGFKYLPPSIRFLPDMLIEDTAKYLQQTYRLRALHAFVEIKGVGKGGVVKIKYQQLEQNLDAIDYLGRPVLYFIYDSYLGRVSISHTTQSIYQTVEDNDIPLKSFHDGNQYYPIPINKFQWETLT